MKLTVASVSLLPTPINHDSSSACVKHFSGSIIVPCGMVQKNACDIDHAADGETAHGGVLHFSCPCNCIAAAPTLQFKGSRSVVVEHDQGKEHPECIPGQNPKP